MLDARHGGLNCRAAWQNALDADRWSRERTVREALSGEFGSIVSGRLPALMCNRSVRFGRRALGLDYQAARRVINRSGTEQDNWVGNPAIHHGLLHGASLAGGRTAVHERRCVSGQPIVRVVVVEPDPAMGLG